MDIFESLENLNVSEECFNDIVGLVEEYINELKNSTIEDTLDAHRDRIMSKAAKGESDPIDTEKYYKSTDRAEKRAREKGQAFSLTDRGKHIHSKLVGDKDGVLYYQRVREAEEDVYEPAAYAKDGYDFMATGSNKLNGKLYKVHTKHDKGVTKTKLYAKDGDSARKLVQKAYGGPNSAHTLANE